MADDAAEVADVLAADALDDALVALVEADDAEVLAFVALVDALDALVEALDALVEALDSLVEAELALLAALVALAAAAAALAAAAVADATDATSEKDRLLEPIVGDAVVSCHSVLAFVVPRTISTSVPCTQSPVPLKSGERDQSPESAS